MRTSSGVKPKIKGSAVLTVLLFVFISAPVLANFSCPSDTIIIDGEVIEIEQNDVRTNLDSLEKKGQKDIRIPIGTVKGFWSVQAGGLASFAPYSFIPDSLQYLSSFLGFQEPMSVSPTAGVQVGLDFNDQFGIRLGAGFSQMKWKYQVLDESQLVAPNLRTNFENRSGELWQRYVVFIDPGFEERFSKIDLSTESITYTTLDVSGAFRFYPVRKKNGWSVYIDLGVAPRISKGSVNKASRAYFLAENGDWRKLDLESSLIPKTIVFMNAEIGGQYHFAETYAAAFQIGYFGLPKKLYTEGTFSRQISSLYAGFAITHFLEWNNPSTYK
jgi:hypothetical protein